MISLVFKLFISLAYFSKGVSFFVFVVLIFQYIINKDLLDQIAKMLLDLTQHKQSLVWPSVNYEALQGIRKVIISDNIRPTTRNFLIARLVSLADEITVGGSHDFIDASINALADVASKQGIENSVQEHIVLKFQEYFTGYNSSSALDGLGRIGISLDETNSLKSKITNIFLKIYKSSDKYREATAQFYLADIFATVHIGSGGVIRETFIPFLQEQYLSDKNFAVRIVHALVDHLPEDHPEKNFLMNIKYRRPDIVAGALSFDDMWAIYSNDIFRDQTKLLDGVNQFSIARAIDSTLKRFGQDVTNENIESVLPVIWEILNMNLSKVIIDANTPVVIIANESEEFDPANIKSFLENVMGVKKIEVFIGSAHKDDVRQAIKNSADNTAIFLWGHGGENHFWLRGGEEGKEKSDDLDHPDGISYKELAKDLIVRARRNRKQLGDLKILCDSCYAANSVINTLNTIAETGIHENFNITQMPVIITSSNRKTGSWAGTNINYSPLRNKPEVTHVSYFSETLKAAIRESSVPVLTIKEILAAEIYASSLQDTTVFLPVSPTQLDQLENMFGRNFKTMTNIPEMIRHSNRSYLKIFQAGPQRVRKQENLDTSLAIINASMGRQVQGKIDSRGQLRTTDANGSKHRQRLTSRGDFNYPYFESQIRGLQGMDKKYKTLVLEIVSLLNNHWPEVFTFDLLQGDFFGRAFPDAKKIVLYAGFQKNPVALFHEAAEYLVGAGLLQFDVQQKALHIKLRRNTEESFEDNVIFLNKESSLDIIRKIKEDRFEVDPQHYYIRAFQNVVFERLSGNEGDNMDLQLTEEIKELKKGGIDFRSSQIDLGVRGDGIKFDFLNRFASCFDDTDLDCRQEELQKFKRGINGLTPVIFQITPIQNLPMLLGVSQDVDDEII